VTHKKAGDAKRRRRSLHAVTGLLTTILSPVETLVYTLSLAVQPAIDSVTLAIESCRTTIPAGCGRPLGSAIQALVNPVTLLVEAMFDTITTIRNTVIAAHGIIGESDIAKCEQASANLYCLLDIHFKSPLRP